MEKPTLLRYVFFVEIISAFRRHWVTATTGSSVVGLLATGSYWATLSGSNSQKAAIAVAIFGVVWLFVAIPISMVQAWWEERQARVASETAASSAIEELNDSRRVSLKCKLLPEVGVSVGGDSGIRVYVTIEVFNQPPGAPSVAFRWRLHLQDGMGNISVHLGHTIQDGEQLDYGGWIVTYSASDEIGKKMATPLPSGDRRVGIFKLVVRDKTPDELVADYSFHLEFSDVMEQVHRSDIFSWQGAQLGTPMIHPALEMTATAPSESLAAEAESRKTQFIRSEDLM